MMRKATLASATILLAVGLANNAAWGLGYETKISGAMCSRVDSTAGTVTHYNSDSINTAGANVQYVCPIVISCSETQDCSGYTLQSVTAYVTDGSASDWVSCYVEAYNESTGSSYFSSTLYPCSTTGGCSTAPASSYTGTDTLTWSASDLSTLNSGSLAFYCYLPSGGSSKIMSYRVALTNLT